MRPRLFLAFLAAALSLHTAGCQTPPPSTPSPTAPAAISWTNPLVPQRADPHVILHRDGHYYLAATVPAYDCIELRRAPTLGELGAASPVVVWRRPASGPMSGYIWAPELHQIDGTWYLYFAGGRAPGMWDIRMYVLENASDG